MNKKFAVLFFSPSKVRGGLFVRNDRQWSMVRCSVADIDSNNPSAAWKHVLKHISCKDGLVLLAGALPGGVFFEFSSADLSVREQRGAVELELPRRVIRIPENSRFQFASSLPVGDGQVNVGVYVFAANAMNSIEARLTQSSCRADGFVYPLLARYPEDPALYLPEIEENFLFADGAWVMVTDKEKAAAKTADEYRRIMDKLFIFPQDDDFEFAAFLPLLLVARLVASGRYDRCRNALAVLPEKLLPVRYRKHVIVSIGLLLLLCVNIFWSASRTWGKDYQSYRAVTSQIKRLKRQIANAKKQAKKSSRELKDMQRVIAAQSGDPEVVPKLALLSNALPPNVLVSSVRWTDNSVDMVLQSEDDKLNLPALINPLGYWRIGQLQQRQTGDSTVATIVLKLIPLKKR